MREVNVHRYPKSQFLERITANLFFSFTRKIIIITFHFIPLKYLKNLSLHLTLTKLFLLILSVSLAILFSSCFRCFCVAMEECFEPYHVPQQSRRDKRRIMAQNQPTTPVTLSGLIPLYDPSSFSSDLLTCAAVSGNTSGSHEFHHPYLDPQSSLPLNPSTIQDMNNNPFIYSTTQHLQNPRDYGHSYNNNNNNGCGEVVVYKPEPLSLYLSNSHFIHHNNFPLDKSGIYSDKVTSTGYMVPSIINGASCSTSNEISRCSVPLGPFKGYASILKGSRFLRPAQQLLEELCDVGKIIHSEKPSLMEPPLQNLSDTGGGNVGGGGDVRKKKPRLSSILDEIYRRYKQCYQQMQAVVASFECVAGLGNAAPYANLAMKAMSKQFKYLKNAITEQLQLTDKTHGHISPGKIESPRLGSSDGSLYNRPVQNSGFLQNQPLWHPQRGLPERAVTVLRAWLFEHFLHPYPTDTDKVMLAKQTGLSRNQVSNWFINARVRLWKPMVEEIHLLETRQAQKASEKEERNANKLGDHFPSAEYTSTSSQRVEGNNTPSKFTRIELPDVLIASEPPNLAYNNCFSSNRHTSGNSSVSLTLGLHRNNGIGLSEPFPINAAQHFGLGLEVSSEGYVIGGFEAQNGQFGRDVGGQILRDFVG